MRERAWAGDKTTSSFIPSTYVPCCKSTIMCHECEDNKIVC
jgi:hypothetical protein